MMSNTAHVEPEHEEQPACCNPLDSARGVANGAPAGHCDDPISCVPFLSEGKGAFELFTEGDALYEAMLDAIRGARTSIRLESYIFASDEIGMRFIRELAEAARSGAHVRVMIDAAGSLFWGGRRLISALEGTRIEVKWYHRWSWRRPVRYNQRNHRKLLVVDDNQVFLGGFNIHRENSRKAYGARRWRDTHVRTTGRLAVEAARQFDAVWKGRQDFMDARMENVPALVISNIFRNCRRRFRCLYWDRISAATERVYLTTPYFAPDWHLQRRLAAAARRGIDVRLLLPGKSDVPVVQWAAHAIYAGLLEAGVRIYEYLPRPLHAKCAAIDGEWSIIGSSNLDYRSLGVNYEINLVARDRVLSRQLEEQFLADLAEAENVSAEIWAGRSWQRRGLEMVGRLLQRWL